MGKKIDEWWQGACDYFVDNGIYKVSKKYIKTHYDTPEKMYRLLEEAKKLKPEYLSTINLFLNQYHELQK